jgi:hypothetical protein
MAITNTSIWRSWIAPFVGKIPQTEVENLENKANVSDLDILHEKIKTDSFYLHKRNIVLNKNLDSGYTNGSVFLTNDDFDGCMYSPNVSSRRNYNGSVNISYASIFSEPCFQVPYDCKIKSIVANVIVNDGEMIWINSDDWSNNINQYPLSIIVLAEKEKLANTQIISDFNFTPNDKRGIFGDQTVGSYELDIPIKQHFFVQKGNDIKIIVSNNSETKVVNLKQVKIEITLERV